MSEESKVDLIYREASRLFAAYGFDGVSMRDIAKACDITLASLYYHFSSKGELHDEITQSSFEDFIDHLKLKQGRLATGEDTPSALMGLIFDSVLVNPTLFNLMQHDLHYFGEDIRYTHSRKRYLAFVRLLSETYRRHHDRSPDDKTLFSCSALITGYCELVQADERSFGPNKHCFIETQRAELIRISKALYD